MKKIIQNFIAFSRKKIKKILVKANKMTLPGFQGQSLYNVGRMFFKGLSEGYIADRAAAVAFNFFTALFPMLLMVFTLIPYVPIENLQENLLYYAKEIIPSEIWEFLNSTITYIITHKSGNLLSISFLLSLYFGTNGVNSLFNAFNQTYHTFTSASNWLKRRWHAFLILMLVFLMIVLFMTILIFGNRLINHLMEYSPLASRFMYYLSQTIRFMLATLSLMLAIALTYYFAMPQRREFHLFSLGTVMAAVLILATTFGFSYFIANFSRYNVLYGSLGTILILTLYLYLNSMFILIGFEMNMSVHSAKNKGQDKGLIRRM